MNFSSFAGAPLVAIKQHKTSKKEKDKERVKELLRTAEVIICQAISVEPYLKRCMLKLGWTLVNQGSALHNRFEISDKEGNLSYILTPLYSRHS